MANELTALFGFFSFWLGACVASFLNVVIWRIPRGESIVSPPSHCPKCGSSIRWWQNVPIISWLVLRGKCANCKAPISPRYIIVEFIGAVLFLAVFLRILAPLLLLDGSVDVRFLWPKIIVLIVLWVWVALMIVGSFIDFDHKLLPDFVTVGGMILGVVNGAISSAVSGRLFPILVTVSGLAFGFGLLWLVRFFGSLAFKREAMGLGDVFLMGAVGALFGPVAVLVTLIFSSLFGSVVGLSAVALSKTRLGSFSEIPYGPYICLGCLLWMFCGIEIVNTYIGALK